MAYDGALADRIRDVLAPRGEIAAEGTAGDADLASWVEAGADYAASLPPKSNS